MKDLNLNRRGYSLLELSIVLAILAFVAGGILIGKDMIYSAQIRQIISQHRQIDSAVSLFQQKYPCLPGDCSISNLPEIVSPGNGGNINSKIDQAIEYVNFWYHLSAASLIPERITAYKFGSSANYRSGKATPAVKLTPRFANATAGWSVRREMPLMYAIDGGAATEIKKDTGHALILSNFAIFLDETATFAAADLFAIDKKADDGFPLSGSVRAWWSISTAGDGFYTVHGVTDPQAARCVRSDGSTAKYNLIYEYQPADPTDGLCSVTMKTSF